MRPIMYDPNSVLLVSLLFVSLVLGIEAGNRIGQRVQEIVSESARSQINAIQDSLLGDSLLESGANKGTAAEGWQMDELRCERQSNEN